MFFQVRRPHKDSVDARHISPAHRPHKLHSYKARSKNKEKEIQALGVKENRKKQRAKREKDRFKGHIEKQGNRKDN